MPNVVIVTTMWGRGFDAEGERREAEMKATFWADMLARGCRVERFRNTYQSAWSVIDGLAEKDWARVQISREMVERRRALRQTEAGITLNNELKTMLKARKAQARILQTQLKKQDNTVAVQELNKQHAETDKQILQTVEQLHELKIPLTSQIISFLLGRS